MDAAELEERGIRARDLQRSAHDVMQRVLEAEGDPERIGDLYGFLEHTLELAFHASSYLATQRIYEMSTQLEYLDLLERIVDGQGAEQLFYDEST